MTEHITDDRLMKLPVDSIVSGLLAFHEQFPLVGILLLIMSLIWFYIWTFAAPALRTGVSLGHRLGRVSAH